MTGDALRNTLDHLALDPESGADRHYLVTVLRRLGYSEQEIREVLGDEGEEGRVIEVEYTGKGATFLFGKPGATRSFSVVEQEDGTQQFTLVDDPEAGVETFEDVDLDDVDVSDDWGDWDDDDDVPEDFEESDDTEGEERLVEFNEASLVQFKEKESDLVPFNMEGDGDGWTEVDGPRGWTETEEWAVEEAPADAWEPVEEADDLEWAEADDGPEAYTYGEYTLYTRPVELTTGKTQHIYFFAKDEPKSGEPCALPDGYEVGVSEKTGLPFLRKQKDPFGDDKQQCGAITEGNKQCRLTAQAGSDFCHVHHDYVPPTEEELRARLDTDPFQDVEDTLPYEEGHEGSQQCAAITQAGMQCRNTARHTSKYCASHKGYHPHSATQDTDTVPVGKHVKDTLPVTSDGGHPKASDPAATRDDPSPFDDHHVPGAQASPPGTRVRVRRVAAEDADAAREQVRQEGGDVRGVVPIRIEEHEDD